MKSTKKIAQALIAACLLGSIVTFTAGCAGTATRPSTGEYIDDSVITTKVKAALVRDDQTPGGAIKVETFKGVVQLSGFVDTQLQKSRAAEVAQGVEGVQSVVNNITVK